MQTEILISKATKNNWSRLNFSEQDIQSKLTKRANKRYSKKNIIPLEYFSNPKNITILQEILNINKNSIQTCIYTLTINILLKNNLINKRSEEYISENEFINEILEPYKTLTPDEKLLKIEIPTDEKDFLGIVYQSLLKEGSKNKQGSYYTPQKIINKITSDFTPNTKYLDPCCGTGSFLLAAADIINNPENLYGYDTDEIACFIAKINLIIKFKNIKFRPKIFNTDFLKDKTNKDFDIIATNPPWGACTKEEYKTLYPTIKSTESYSYFIVNCANKLTPNGKMYFVLPESILNVKTHQDIRTFILDNFHIEKIEQEGKAFSSVLSNVITLVLDKNTKNKNIKIVNKNETNQILQSYYETNTNKNFSLINAKDTEILDKIYKTPHKTLNNDSLWALGIVTGNNAKFISKNPNSGEKIYSGKNIEKYNISDSDQYINYDRKKFQQVAPDEIYKAPEKLVYKFISKKLIFAYDNQQRLFLNSANILIPKLDDYSIKEILALLNSTLFQYIYLKKFNELKILKGNLMELPFPYLNKKTKQHLKEILQNSSNISDIDKLIYEQFNLTKDEQDYIIKEVNYK